MAGARVRWWEGGMTGCFGVMLQDSGTPSAPSGALSRGEMCCAHINGSQAEAGGTWES